MTDFFTYLTAAFTLCCFFMLAEISDDLKVTNKIALEQLNVSSDSHYILTELELIKTK